MWYNWILMPPSDVVLHTDRRLERQLGAFRLGAGICAMLGSLWLHWVAPGVLSWALLLTSLAFALLWGARFFRQQAAAGGSRPSPELTLDATGIRLSAPQGPQQVPWAQISDIWIDEDRLQVLVGRHGTEPLRLEPCYEGLNLYTLLSLLRQQALDRGCMLSDPALK